MRPVQPLDVVSLFPPLHTALCEVLDPLDDADWRRPTAAGAWTVKDVAAHLLDGNIRRLSFQRDGWPPPAPETPVASYPQLVDHMNRLNATWIAAMQRTSPAVLLDLLKQTGPRVSAFFASLDPEAEALFGVAWAGQETSPNWFDIAREYTEKWHHQQQIRAAVDAPLLTEPRWLHPYLDTLVRGLPHAYRAATAPPDTHVGIAITGDAGGHWTLHHDADGWALLAGTGSALDARIALSDDDAWRLFSNMMQPESARKRITASGPSHLIEPLLRFVGFMV